MILGTLLAACIEGIGCITPYVSPALDPTTGKLTGAVVFANSLLKLVFVVAGLFSLINFILAGFDFMGDGGDPKNISKAWNKIWQTLVGLFIIVISFLLAAIIGILLFGKWDYLLQPTLGPPPSP